MDEDEAKEVVGHNGKRKGTIYRCESCSKVGYVSRSYLTTHADQRVARCIVIPTVF